MKTGDLPAVEKLTEGRNVHRDEYARFLQLEGGHGFVLESEDTVVGATTVFRCFERAVLGPTLLAPHQDGPGIALAMLGASIKQLQLESVTLVDAEAGQVEAPLLEAMGFRGVRRTLIMERPPGPTGRAPTTRPMERADLLDVGALDADAVGFGRKEFISALLEGARVSEGADGDVNGFVTTRPARRGYHLGPIVTRASGDVEQAKRLALDAVGAVSAWPVVALAPEQGGLVPALREWGFAEVGALTRLRAGEAAPGGAAHEWLVGSRLTG